LNVDVIGSYSADGLEKWLHQLFSFATICELEEFIFRFIFAGELLVVGWIRLLIQSFARWTDCWHVYVWHIVGW
jgi:hypothetical protein